jgi:predicted transport protein
VGDIKLFSIANGNVRELQGANVAVERRLQRLIEGQLETFLGMRFLATEFTTSHGGRIDTLALDENGSPVIIEYKRAVNENVINQGLFYLTWLLDHKADFELLTLKALGKAVTDTISWASPRLVCIAGDFTRYDEHAVQQMGRSIDLFRYKTYGDDLLVLELVASTQAPASRHASASTRTENTEAPPTNAESRGAAYHVEHAPSDLRDRYDALRAFLLALGDDVQEVSLATYIAFRRIRNFACVLVQPRPKHIVIWAKVDPSSITLEQGFTRDVSNIGHPAPGDLQITLRTAADLQRAEMLLRQSYEAS